MTLMEGYELVRRFRNKRVNISKVWRRSSKIAEVAAKFFVTKAVFAPLTDGGEVLNKLLDVWFTSNKDDRPNVKTISEAIRRIVTEAESSAHIYILGDAIEKHYGSSGRLIIVELLVRGLTTDLNVLEKLKQDENVDGQKETKTRMSTAFDKLARILADRVEVARECALTAFSLTPTEQRLELIEEFARQSGYEVDESSKNWTCRLHPPTLPSDEVAWKCDECGDYMSRPKVEAALNKTNTLLCEALTAEKLELDTLLCDDLVVLLSSPKNQILSWLLAWPDLHRICVMYLRDQQSIQCIISELKFAEPDYSLYMRPVKVEPIEEDNLHPGIEKGYERFLTISPVPSDNSETESATEGPDDCRSDLDSCACLPVGVNRASFSSGHSDDYATTSLLPLSPNTLRQYRKRQMESPSPPEVSLFLNCNLRIAKFMNTVPAKKIAIVGNYGDKESNLE